MKGEKDETNGEDELTAYDVSNKKDFHRIAKRHSEKANKNFFDIKRMMVQWKSPKSDVTYDLCIAEFDYYDELDEKDWDWPRAWVGKECQTVLSAVWRDRKLVAINTFSPHGDETNFFYNDQMNEEDAWSLLEDDQFTEYLHVSSGDEKVESLNCPALETLDEPSN